VGDTGDDGGTTRGRGSHRLKRPAWWRRLVRAEQRRAGQRGLRTWTWRVGTPVAFVAAGALLVTSQINAGGTDLRPGRYDNLADLAEQQSARLQDLRTQVADLNHEIDGLTHGLTENGLSSQQAKVDQLREPAGVTAVHGPGIEVTLDDAPAAVRQSVGEQDREEVIVHQQDIQAVANALWAGGAEAMTIQGQRVVSTTGIKCVGNTVILHGIPYSPPYRIAAIGDQDTLRRSLMDSGYVQAYLQDVQIYELGWDVQERSDIQAPAYDGSMDMRYAQPIPPRSS
jgi:uncharacterized protein YlxW (UPF0749 family)